MTLFDGSVTVRIHFRNRIEYEKFRKYILKTEWAYQIDYPVFEEKVMVFHNTEEFEAYNRLVIYLLQLGFDVYSCRFQMNTIEAQVEEQQNQETEEDYGEFDIGKMVDDIWRKCRSAKETSPKVEEAIS